MRPFLALLATATLTMGPTGAATSATAAAATCRGVPATITAPGVPQVVGTEGDDVMVVGSGSLVDALGGDDLVCVVGDGFTLVDAGTGDDVVDATGTSTTSTTTTYLGDGDDTYVGSASGDSVHAGTRNGIDVGRDVVDTGPRGPRSDQVTSGQGVEPNGDRITGGRMALIWAGTPTSTSSAVVGRDSVFRTEDRGLPGLAIDSRAGTLTTGGSGQALRLSGFTTFQVRAHRDLERFTFRGSTRDETVVVSNAYRPVVRIAMSGGDDELVVGTYARGSRFSGGAGRDLLDVKASTLVDLDLRGETLTTGSGRRSVTREADSFEDAFVRADRARLEGTNGPNRLSADACAARIEGLGGRDRLTAFNNTGYDQSGNRCRGQSRLTMRLDGGAGNDTLVGSTARDLLVGGPGRDRGDGRQGRDTCQVEVRQSCEVRR